jgi:hypothetical protein
MREREREIQNLGEDSERHYQVWGGVRNNSCCLEGSQASPAIPSDSVRFEFSVKNNLIWCSWRYGGCFGSKFEYLVHWEGCMGSMQCNVEFGYQLSICSATTSFYITYINSVRTSQETQYISVD